MKALMIGAAALAGATLVAASPAAAQANVMKDCAVKYQTAKANKTLPAGQTWIQFLAQCRKATPAAAPVVAASASKTTAIHTVATQTTTKTSGPAAARAPGQRTPGQLAEASRQKQCGAQWKADKAAGKTGSQTWPQYWSACSKRLKG